MCQAYSDNQNPCTSTEMNSAFKVNGLAFLRRLDGNVSISTSNLPHVNSFASRSRTGHAVQEGKV